MKLGLGWRRAAAWGVGLLLLGGTAGQAAQAPGSDNQVTVTIGGARCFIVRCPDGELTPAERVEQIHVVFARHLGSSKGEFALQKSPVKGSARIDILLNGDRVISVTTNDARATRFQKPDEVAPIWKSALERAFQETHARPESQRK